MNGFVIVGKTTQKPSIEKNRTTDYSPALQPITIGETEYHVHGCIDCPGAVIRARSVYCGFQNANQPYAILRQNADGVSNDIIIGKGCPLLTKEDSAEIYRREKEQWDRIWIPGFGYVDREDAESIRAEMRHI